MAIFGTLQQGSTSPVITQAITLSPLPAVRPIPLVTFIRKIWRRRPDLNRGWRFCRPLPYHLATAPLELRYAVGVRPRAKRDLNRPAGQPPPATPRPSAQVI